MRSRRATVLVRRDNVHVSLPIMPNIPRHVEPPLHGLNHSLLQVLRFTNGTNGQTRCPSAMVLPTTVAVYTLARAKWMYRIKQGLGLPLCLQVTLKPLSQPAPGMMVRHLRINAAKALPV